MELEVRLLKGRDLKVLPWLKVLKFLGLGRAALLGKEMMFVRKAGYFRLSFFLEAPFLNLLKENHLERVISRSNSSRCAEMFVGPLLKEEGTKFKLLGRVYKE